MTVLDDLLRNYKPPQKIQIVREICDKIFEEEKPKFRRPINLRPTGPNIFLALECPETATNVVYLCLEREEMNSFILSIWNIKKNNITDEIVDPPSLKRVASTTQLDSSLDAEGIMKEYVKKFKYMKGE